MEVNSTNKKVAKAENQQLNAKETKQFWSKIWAQKEHNRKAKWINNMKNNNKNSKRRCCEHISKIAQGNTHIVPNWKTS